jgi:16S rRNA (cytidine1402-2'-O)-methyltransferase
MLYIVGTPIGNLSDISERAIETLKKVDFILCEDTRVTDKLCSRFGIETSLMSYHHHSDQKKMIAIMKKLKKGLDLALVTDSGTPGIADPAGKLIKKVTEAKVSQVVPIPGPSAVSVAACISGFYMNKFTFLGFPPKKRKRKKFFEEALDYEHPVIFYESPYRILKTLQEICDIDPENETVVCRELTKMHETIYRGSAQKVLEDLEAEKHTKGEFTVIIKN